MVNPKASDDLGDHHLGTGVGTGGGALAGAAIGAAGGPVGMAAGAAIGALAGGAVGKGAAKVVNPAAEDAYWSGSYASQPYYSSGMTYDDYGPAYRLGVDARSRYQGNYAASESALQSEWEKVKGKSRLTWAQAKQATRSAWDRIEGAVAADSRRDGK